MSAEMRAPPDPRRIKQVALWLGLLMAVFSCVIYLSQPQILNDIESRMLDARFKFRGAINHSGVVAIAAVDEASLEAYGRWPWSREKLAKLIEAINQAGAGVIGLDIVFAEPQANPIEAALKEEDGRVPAELLQEIRSKVDMRSPDEILAKTFREAGNIVNGYFLYTNVDQAKGVLPPTPEEELVWMAKSAVTAVRSKSENFLVNEAVGVKPNIQIITEAGYGGGYFNMLPGSDGIVRTAPLVTRYKEDLFSSLALKSFAAAMGDAPIVVFAEDYGITHITVGDRKIDTDEYGTIKINYRGPPKTIPTYSVVDIMEGRLPEGALQDKVVLLGITAIGVYDAHSTSFGPSFPGLEIQATVLDNLIVGDPLQRSGVDSLIDMGTMLLMSVLLILALPRLKHVSLRFLYASVLSLVLVYINYWWFAEKQLWIGLAYPLMSTLLTYVSISLYLSIAVERRHSVVRSAFQSYLHPALVDQLTEHPELLHFGGETKEISILFSDIRSFTNLSEGLTPQQLAHFMNCYMDPMTAEVLNHEGTLDKYIGDAVMALYGAPLPVADHPKKACDSAIAMIDALDNIKDCCPELDVFPVRIGVGIHTGEVVVGNLGSSYRFAYTALGDNVNLASRLEGLSKPYGVNIVISETTYQAVKEDFHCRELDLVRVKGKQVPIRIYELKGRQLEENELAYLKDWEAALETYYGRDWPGAQQRFRQLQESVPDDKTTQMYIDRCQHHEKNPPPADWDGVTTFTTK